jgi:ATP-dependent Lon protease
VSEEKEDFIEAETNGNGSEDKDRQGGLVVAAEVLPATLPILPLKPRPAFPGIIIPMAITGDLQVAAIKRAMASPSQALGLVLVRNPDEEDAPENLHRVGVVAKILKVIHEEEESVHLLINSL